MKRLRLLLGDDHVLFLEGVRTLLEGNFEIVGALENGRELLEAAVAIQPDAILLDITMPLLNGIDATRQLRTLVPQSKIIIVTMHAGNMSTKPSAPAHPPMFSSSRQYRNW